MRNATGRAVTRPLTVIGFTMFFVMLILLYVGIGWALPVALFFGFFLLLSILIPRLRQQRVLPLLMATGVIASGLFVFAYKMQYEPALILADNTVQAEIQLTDEVFSRNGRCYGSGVTETVNGKAYRLKVRVVFDEYPDAEAYDIISGKFYLKKQSPYGAAALSTDAESGSCLDAYPRGSGDGSFSVQSFSLAQKPLRYRFLLLRDALNCGLKSVICGERGELCSALLFGKSDAFPTHLKTRFNAVGVSHMVCVSGLHLSVWVLGAYTLLRRLAVKRRIAALAAIVFIGCYAALTAFPASVIRAGIMMAVVMAGKLFRRRGDGLNSLGLSAILILLQNPFSVADLGFSLSFLSTLGILLFSSPMQNRLMALFPVKMPALLRKAVAYPLGVVTVTAGAMVFTMPLLLLNFGSVHLISFLGNLLLLPAVSCCMVTAGFTAIFACIPFLGWLASAVGFVSALFSQYLISIVTALAHLKSVSVAPVREAACLWIVFSAVFSVVAWHFFRGFPRVKTVTALAVLLCFMIVNIGSVFERRYATELRVIGVGDAMAVLLRNGNQSALLGCGRDDKGSFYALTDALEDAGVDTLDLLLLPTADRVNSGNAAPLLQRMTAVEIAYYEGLSQWKNQLLHTDLVPLQGTVRRTLWEDCTLTVTSEEGGVYAVVECCGIKTLIMFDGEPITESADFLVTRGNLTDETVGKFRGVFISGSGCCADYEDDERVICTDSNGDILLRIRRGGRYQLITNG